MINHREVADLDDLHLDLALSAVPTERLKALLARRVVADAAALYHGEEERTMSKKPSQQRAAARANAETDKKHWEGKVKAAKDPVSRATYERAVARNQDIIDRNS